MLTSAVRPPRAPLERCVRSHLVQGLAQLLPRLVQVLLEGVRLEHQVVPLVLLKATGGRTAI